MQALTRGRLAQLVQSTSFTPRGSGVRIPQRPHQSKNPQVLRIFYFLTTQNEVLEVVEEIKKKTRLRLDFSVAGVVVKGST